jgi:hypothetical protein
MSLSRSTFNNSPTSIEKLFELGNLARRRPTASGVIPLNHHLRE